METIETRLSECSWYSQAKQRTVMGIIMEEIYGCNRCYKGLEIKCKGYINEKTKADDLLKEANHPLGAKYSKRATHWLWDFGGIF